MRPTKYYTPTTYKKARKTNIKLEVMITDARLNLSEMVETCDQPSEAKQMPFRPINDLATVINKTKIIYFNEYVKSGNKYYAIMSISDGYKRFYLKNELAAHITKCINNHTDYGDAQFAFNNFPEENMTATNQLTVSGTQGPASKFNIKQLYTFVRYIERNCQILAVMHTIHKTEHYFTKDQLKNNVEYYRGINYEPELQHAYDNFPENKRNSLDALMHTIPRAQLDALTQISRDQVTTTSIKGLPGTFSQTHTMQLDSDSEKAMREFVKNMMADALSVSTAATKPVRKIKEGSVLYEPLPTHKQLFNGNNTSYLLDSGYLDGKKAK